MSGNSAKLYYMCLLFISQNFQNLVLLVHNHYYVFLILTVPSRLTYQFMYFYIYTNISSV
jgi:hypothetical protein